MASNQENIKPGDLHLLPSQQCFSKAYSVQDILLADIIAVIRKNGEHLDKQRSLMFIYR